MLSGGGGGEGESSIYLFPTNFTSVSFSSPSSSDTTTPHVVWFLQLIIPGFSIFEDLAPNSQL